MSAVDQQAGRRPAIDGVRLAVLAHRFEAIARLMMNTLVRTGRSGVLNTAQDFSCAIFTESHELLAVAESQPVHVLSGDLMTRSMVELHPDFRPGDAFLHNSPYHGNTHAADHTILVPVFDEQGEHRFTVLAKGHQADCGNATPTTYAAEARDVYEEGALIFPCVSVQRDRSDVEDVIRMCEMRVRVPQQWRGDYLALLGSARVGERRLAELGAELGWDTLAEYARAWFD
jgi:N-methylhydantoinase B